VTVDDDSIREEEERLEALRTASGHEKVAVLRDILNDVMERAGGIIRDRTRMEKGIEEIRNLKMRYLNIGVSDHGHVFNTEWILVLELGHMLDVSECLLTAAVAREESRGSHVRTDFPNREDERFLHHQLAQMKDGKMSWSNLPVTMTKWEPQERKY
ncbi:MAG: Fumarate reductase flavoprotein subunit, partial [Candidatus Peregrinibacteria bacterium GW2011_GWA2_44_7]